MFEKSKRLLGLARYAASQVFDGKTFDERSSNPFLERTIIISSGLRSLFSVVRFICSPAIPLYWITPLLVEMSAQTSPEVGEKPK
jgi:hypothetical protein